MRDPHYIYRPLLDLIGYTEGTDEGDGYNETLAYGRFTGGDRELVKMTLDEIDHLQTAMLAHPKNRWNSSAVGRYQIVRTTLRKIRKKLQLTGAELFDEKMQDKMACFLLGGRGIDKWLAGRMSEDGIINALAREWASLPTTAGKGAYSGQHARVSVDRVRQALAEVKARASGKSPQESASAQKPVPLTKEPSKPSIGSPAPVPGRKRKGLIASILAALGLGGAGAATQVDPDRIAAWILGGVVVLAIAGVVVLIIRRMRK